MTKATKPTALLGRIETRGGQQRAVALAAEEVGVFVEEQRLLPPLGLSVGFRLVDPSEPAVDRVAQRRDR